MDLKLTSPERRVLIQTAKILACFAGYLAILQVVQWCEARGILSWGGARSALMSITVIVTFLALTYSLAFKSKSLIKALLAVGLCTIVLSAGVKAIGWWARTHALPVPQAHALTLVFAFATLFVVLVAIFNPFKHEITSKS